MRQESGDYHGGKRKLLRRIDFQSEPCYVEPDKTREERGDRGRHVEGSALVLRNHADELQRKYNHNRKRAREDQWTAGGSPKGAQKVVQPRERERGHNNTIFKC
ncbi:unnamed protein product [Pleuronectes platessa]|uniref:Uncharacterized protein n=1 Tax=Pleuronectes platessa TaxID=8262 RepID=A0A9N7UYV9_PLEPL|nr:unnamed protein product [Pleuronectes platessa]